MLALSDSTKYTFGIFLAAKNKLSFSESTKSVIFLSERSKEDNSLTKSFVFGSSRDLNKVSIYIHNGKEVKRLEQSKIKQYINMKIDGNKDQDREAGRVIRTPTNPDK